MSDSSSSSRKRRKLQRRYRSPPKPIEFPEDAAAPETRHHYELRTTLFHIVKLALSDQACLGTDQYVYWNAADPSRRLSPDLFLRLGVPDSLIRSWKTWERGSPELAVEIVSDSDATELAWDEKLRRYREVGIKELVRFDPIARTEMLRIWDRVQGDLVERELENPLVAESNVTRYTWVVVKDATLGRMLRLAYDVTGKKLLPTPVEREVGLRTKEEERRQVAERRVVELEEQLRRRR